MCLRVFLFYFYFLSNAASLDSGDVFCSHFVRKKTTVQVGRDKASDKVRQDFIQGHPTSSKSLKHSIVKRILVFKR